MTTAKEKSIRTNLEKRKDAVRVIRKAMNAGINIGSGIDLLLDNIPEIKNSREAKKIMASLRYSSQMPAHKNPRKSLRDLKRAEAEHYARPAVSIDIDVDSHNAKRGSKTRVNPASPDSIAAHELALYAENNGDLYRQRIDPIIKNLKRKQVKGIYDPALALKLWKYAADDAAKRYSREFGGNFSVATRKLAASELAEYYEEFLKNPLKGEKHIALQEKRGGNWFTIAWFPHTEKALAIRLGKQVHRKYPHKELRVFA